MSLSVIAKLNLDCQFFVKYAILFVMSHSTVIVQVQLDAAQLYLVLQDFTLTLQAFVYQLAVVHIILDHNIQSQAVESHIHIHQLFAQLCAVKLVMY